MRSGRYSSSMGKKQNDFLTIEANKLPKGWGGGKLASSMNPSLPSSQSFHPCHSSVIILYHSVKHYQWKGHGIYREVCSFPYIPHS